MDALPTSEIQTEYHISEPLPLTPNTLKKLNQFCEHEFSISEFNNPSSTAPNPEKLDHTTTISFIKRNIQHLTNTPDGFAHIIYDHHNQPVAVHFYGHAIYQGKDCINDFIGVSWHHTKKGLATQLISARIKILQQLGVTQYPTSTRHPGIFSAYKKLGITVEPIPNQQDKYTVHVPPTSP